MKKMQKIMAMILALSMILSLTAFTASATETDEIETIWNGDSLSIDVTAGKDGYTFMSAYRNPAHAYEISNHVFNDGNGNATPQTLIMIDASKDYTWTPNGRYSFGTNNYEVLYCCDAITGYEDGIYYKRMNLEDSDYYDEESAAHIRAIITNSYPYISLEQMKADLAAAGFEGAEDLDRAEIIAGVQTAIWYYANGGADYKYVKSYNVAATPGYGTVLHDFTAEMSTAIQALGNAKTLKDYEAGARAEALADYLKGLEKVNVESDGIVITNLEIVDACPAGKDDGTFVTTIRVALNNGGSSDADNVKLDIYVDGELVKTKDVHQSMTTYDVTVTAKVGQTVKAVVSGTQVLPKGVYFYEPEGGRDVSQSLVGIASGETNVYAAKELTVESSTNVQVDKTAEWLDTNQSFAGVSLSVPGDYTTTGVDIIYILGSFLSKDAVETNIMISCLMETFAELIEAGVPVNFGIVPFSSTEDPVMDFVTLRTLADLEALPAQIAAAIEDAGNVYDQVNMENALITATEMFSQTELGKAGRTDRQHLVLLSSGHTYYFNSGDNNEYISTVPVSFNKGNLVSGEIFYMEKAWMRARNNSTNSYPIPKAFVDEYNANPDKYASAWDCYWYYIDLWAQQDIAAGDTVVYEATTRAAGDFKTWMNSGKYSAYSSTFTYSGNGAVVSSPAADALKDVLVFNMTDSTDRGVKMGVSGPNPFLDESAAHAISYERAMWEAYTYVQENITGKGINFYPIYTELRDETNANPHSATNGYDYGWYDWTDQYIGHSFMNMLAGGEAIFYSKTDNKAFFDPIKAEILYTCDVGSYVEDYIGYDPEIGNFEFITDAETIVLTVGGVEYTTTQIATKEGADASYAFTAPGASEPTFWLDYYYGNGTTTEKFIWTFGEPVSLANKVVLDYQLELIDKITVPGDYIIETNLSATLYPKNTDDGFDLPVIFPVPELELDVPDLPASVVIEGNKYLDGVASVLPFTFELIDEMGNVITTINDANGHFAFEALLFSEEGEYTFTVKEVEADGFNCDKTEFTVVITVTRVGGVLTAAVDGAENIAFNNETIIPETDPTTESTTEPTEPSTEATEPSTEATEPSTEATEPSTEATEPETEPDLPTEPDEEVEEESVPLGTLPSEPETEPTEEETFEEEEVEDEDVPLDSGNPSEPPKTGDANSALVAVIGALAAVSMAVLVLNKKRI